MSYSYNRIHNDYDNNVVRVELNSAYRPRVNRATSREPIRITSSVSRTDTFTKNDRPSNIIRSDTFILKHHNNDESSDERPDYNTYTRSKKKSFSDEKKQLYDDKSNYSTYTRSEKKGNEICGMALKWTLLIAFVWPFLGNGHESLYINTDTYRKADKKPRSSLSQESENLNSNTFTKSSKPKRVESLIKRFDMSFWRRNKEPKEKSPSPSGSDTVKRSKNIFNTLISSGKKSTRDVGIECKMDEDRDYYSGMGTRKSSIQSLISEKKHHRPLKSSKRFENGSNQQLTSIIKPPERRYPYYEKKSTTLVPAPIRVEIGGRNSINKYTSDMESKRRPIGIASPLPQARNRSVLKSTATRSYESKRPEINAPTKVQEINNFNREGSDRISFREYREKLKIKKDGRRITDNSDDELRKSYQQSFFIPM